MPPTTWWCSRSCTAPSARTAPCKGCSSWRDVAYVGAGVLGSAMGMDKDVAKRLLRDAGIPVVDFTRRHGRGVRARSRGGAAPALPGSGWPLFVKPVNAGSSVGVSRVNGPDGLAPAVRAALAFDRKVLIERAVDAREIECAVLGNDEPLASVPGEILVHHKDGFYSYDAKYVDPSGASWKIPADLPAETAARVQSSGGRDLPDARAGRAGPRRFFSRARRRRPLRQRGQHPPRIHGGFDVSEDVGGFRPVTKGPLNSPCRPRPAKVEGPPRH